SGLLPPVNFYGQPNTNAPLLPGRVYGPSMPVAPEQLRAHGQGIMENRRAETMNAAAHAIPDWNRNKRLLPAGAERMYRGDPAPQLMAYSAAVSSDPRIGRGLMTALGDYCSRAHAARGARGDAEVAQMIVPLPKGEVAVGKSAGGADVLDEVV